MRSRLYNLPMIAVLGTAMTVLSACSHMSAKECSVVDWRSVGYEDGVRGLPGDHIRTYREACAKYGITSDFASYQAGRDSGLQEYCQPANGYRVGADGYEYSGVCPAPLEGPFSSAYQAGHERYTFESRANNAAAQLADARRRREQLQQQMVSSGAAVFSPGTSPEMRAHALLDTNQLAEESGRLDAQIVQLELDQQRYDRELASYRARVATNR